MEEQSAAMFTLATSEIPGKFSAKNPVRADSKGWKLHLISLGICLELKKGICGFKQLKRTFELLGFMAIL